MRLTRWVRLGGVALLALSGACQPGLQPEAPDGEPVAAAPAQLASDQALALDSELARLTAFWAVERFALNEDQVVRVNARLDRELLAKAAVDECFQGIGVPATKPPCVTGKPKVNQAYAWSLTRYRDTLYFGTVANVPCQVPGMVLGASGLSPLEVEGDVVCEFDQSASGTGDWRAPDLWKLDTVTGELVSLNPAPGTAADQIRQGTTGFRSAGTYQGVTFLAGPQRDNAGIAMFAFDSETGALLNAVSLPEYGDIRAWVVMDKAIYTGVSLTGVAPGQPGGAVLRWRGTKSTNPALLFQFEIVGLLDSEAANLTQLDHRLFITTWPSGDPGGFSLWRSPKVKERVGLTAAQAEHWERLWSVADYDPDPFTRSTYGGGAIAAFDGKVIFGSMALPGVAASIAAQLHQAGMMNLDANSNGTLDTEELLTTFLGTHRPPSLFELSNPGGKQPTVKLLYGEKYFPIYDPSVRSYTIAYDAAHENGMNVVPRRGSSGFGNFFNAYIWSAEVWRGKLYLGTFDWSILVKLGLQELLGSGMVPAAADGASASAVWDYLGGNRLPRLGADLYRMDSHDSNVVAESVTGVGNDRNYGVRTMVSDHDALYVGTANPANLHERGGWEILRLTP